MSFAVRHTLCFAEETGRHPVDDRLANKPLERTGGSALSRNRAEAAAGRSTPRR